MTACRFCDSPRTVLVTQFKDLVCPLVHCAACDGVFAEKEFTADELADAYRAFYQPGGQYDPHLGEFEAVKANTVPRLGWNKRQFFSVAPKDMTGLRVLELGAGAGVFGLACMQRGATYRGFDLSTTIVQRVQAETKIHITEGTWKAAVADVAPNSIDYLVGWEVFEHVPDIRDALIGLRSLLKPTAKLVLSVPNYLRYRYNKPGQLGQDPPPIHINFWSPIAMTNFLRVCGYSVLSTNVRRYRTLEPKLLGRALKEIVGSFTGEFDGPTMVVVAEPAAN